MCFLIRDLMDCRAFYVKYGRKSTMWCKVGGLEGHSLCHSVCYCNKKRLWTHSYQNIVLFFESRVKKKRCWEWKMRFLCARHVLSLVKMSCFFVLCRKTWKQEGVGRAVGGRKTWYFFQKEASLKGSLRKKKYIFQWFWISWGGVWAWLEAMLDSANLTFLWSWGNGVRSSCLDFSRILRILWSNLTYFVKKKDEICHIPIEVSKKSDVAWQEWDKIRQIPVEDSNKSAIFWQGKDKVCQISIESNKKDGIDGQGRGKCVRFLLKLAASLTYFVKKQAN